MVVASVALCLLSNFSSASKPYRPSVEELRKNYDVADKLRAELTGKAFKLAITPNWIDSNHFWYRNDLRDSKREFILVDAVQGDRKPLFDADRLAKVLAAKAFVSVKPDRLPITTMVFSNDRKTVTFVALEKTWDLNLESYELNPSSKVIPTAPSEIPRPGRRNRRDNSNPGSDWSAMIRDGNVFVTPKTGGEAIQLSKAGTVEKPFDRFSWAPDGKHLVAVRLIPGDRLKVNLIQSSPVGGGRAVLKSRGYDLPGDVLDKHEVFLFDVAAKSEKKIDAEPFEIEFNMDITWRPDGSAFYFEHQDRGNTRFRMYEVNATSGSVRTVIDHPAKTFIDQTTRWLQFSKNRDMIFWRSEKDGWGRLYSVDVKSTKATPITTGDWVVRMVDAVNEDARQIWFQASGVHPGENPYFLHYFRVNFDGSNLVEITPSAGNHTVKYSADYKYAVDTYSTIDQPPVHELRRTDTGALVCKLESADIGDLRSMKWSAPEPFVSKARDGVTDIWGVVYRPRNFNPNLSYPIIENIYAGPQDSFVPNSFAPYNYMQSIAELGFIVVQCDGMGTRNRSKAFHDVCWKNLADAGLPDRILWITALAKKYPYMDVNRVGVFGTSAGGQNSTGAVLFHPEFYKVAVSSCGCHDNRMDKYWWNEQWMGYPVGKHYEEQSNITNAAKLKGNLLLMVGELDTNVPPESTYRLVDSLIKAGKEFDFVVLPGLDHTAGGTYGERKRRDFFVRHLLGVEPPTHN